MCHLREKEILKVDYSPSAFDLITEIIMIIKITADFFLNRVRFIQPH